LGAGYNLRAASVILRGVRLQPLSFVSKALHRRATCGRKKSSHHALVWLTPIAAVEYLEASLAFASIHDLGVAIAEFDLTNRPPGRIDLPKDYRRAA
jgi:hypothetical protein